ncbi:MAG TPA: glutamate--tRNA ligase family protein, partial [Solirubrobacter sp.]|nr:glutamate--tRNA ligase family protein [Solirubrobacter sp.]
IEDLDVGRVRSRFAAEQLADLAAIGLEWDEPVLVQSERSAVYAAALAGLDVYECFCTRAEIREAASAAHGPVGAYPGTCRDLSAAERAARRAAGRVPALRVRADGATVTFRDRLLGDVSGAVDDFVVRRNDGAYAYNLAVVVDDAATGIEEVVRGADLVDSTPRQIWLARALGVAVPAYAHVPLVLGPDGRRLAKRDGDVTLRTVAPGDAVAWMAASLGLPPARDAAALLDAFDPSALPREPTVFG